MKNLTHKWYQIIIPTFLIIIVGIISNLTAFPFMNYNFILDKKIFICMSIFQIVLFNLSYYKVKILMSKDDIYVYHLHYLLIIMWLFLFFLYKQFIISFFLLCFNLILLCLIISFYIKLKKKNLCLFMYLIWYVYILIINFLVI